MEDFDRENIDELLKFIKCVNTYFPCQNFVLYGMYTILYRKLIGLLASLKCHLNFWMHLCYELYTSVWFVCIWIMPVWFVAHFNWET